MARQAARNSCRGARTVVRRDGGSHGKSEKEGGKKEGNQEEGNEEGG
jgi:hypothetical protein